MHTKACFLLKMVHIRLNVLAQKRFFFYCLLFIHPVCLPVCAHSSFCKHYFNLFILIYGIQVDFDVFHYGIYHCWLENRGALKRMKRHYSQWVKTFKRTFYYVYTALNVMKLTWAHEHTKRRCKWMYIDIYI